ncbi:hypothetical protein K445DRAFT_313292 [Daldinia sp. EC12]|nr:hypothetical protein K445DRAFT_313292 [Daldinia sp. EC12]
MKLGRMWLHSHDKLHGSLLLLFCNGMTRRNIDAVCEMEIKAQENAMRLGFSYFLCRPKIARCTSDATKGIRQH